ncbi:MAG: tRNA dihydrouridine(20/20a) synthase DusA [Xanthomonadales bacterium]|nr:tRNA dihydrouridine(20/20a) synthase DusA [Xanthomonadales bacterium]
MTATAGQAPIASAPPSTGAAAAARRLSVAPMMDWTDRHCRVLHRRLAPHALLYTEMLHANALVRGDAGRLLAHDGEEHPLALQLGGSDPSLLGAAARIGVEHGMDEINLNCGCPSERVQDGAFGACLMREPARVADCVAAMRAAVPAAVPVTVKCRIGVDEQDDYEDLERFVEIVSGAGCGVFVVHARKAWLKGLSPRENREVPPLDWPRVYRLKRERPALTVVLNGGLEADQDIDAALARVDGVMLGRAAYHTPWRLAQIEHRLFGTALPDRQGVIAGLRGYVESRLAKGDRLASIVRHWLGLAHGLPGARPFRRILTESARQPGAGWPVVEQALAALAPALDEAA